MLRRHGECFNSKAKVPLGIPGCPTGPGLLGPPGWEGVVKGPGPILRWFKPQKSGCGYPNPCGLNRKVGPSSGGREVTGTLAV